VTKNWSIEDFERVSAKAKYLFDLDFGAGADAAGRPIAPSESSTRLPGCGSPW
jgi:hypothetical protein